LDTLLSLQTPRTPIPDETIFIIYHQITELYFKLSLHEIEQIAAQKDLEVAWLTERIQRINRYFQALTQSFAVMEKGLDREQFHKFRMSLIPSSGFQSAQYRMIEIGSTPLPNLVHREHRERLRGADIPEQFSHIYWRWGAMIEQTGEKTLTLKRFEAKYEEELLALCHKYQGQTIWDRCQSLPEGKCTDPKLVEALRHLDQNVNVNWPLQHYRTAVVYLAKKPNDVKATGGTNWQKYLPPRFQKRVFYPELWTPQQLEEWGKDWVESALAEARG
jgi:tryptophan 2,3-dioxygenase